MFLSHHPGTKLFMHVNFCVYVTPFWLYSSSGLLDIMVGRCLLTFNHVYMIGPWDKIYSKGRGGVIGVDFLSKDLP